jgi:hypothetical protein
LDAKSNDCIFAAKINNYDNGTELHDDCTESVRCIGAVNLRHEDDE